MDVVIVIAQFLIDNKDYIGLTCVFLPIAISIVILLHEHKEKLWRRIIHRRNKYFFVILIVSAFGIAALSFLHILSAGWLYSLDAIFLSYCVVCCVALKPKMVCTHLILKKYKKLLDEGFINENISFFQATSHWFLLDADEKIQYQLLRSLYFSAINDHKVAYNVLASIRDEYLYEEEELYINMRKAMHLALLGNMTTASLLLEDPGSNMSEDPMIWITYSYIFENSGKIDKAFQYAKKARDLMELVKTPKPQKAAVYNDYARYALIHNNESESLRYYRLAYEEAKHSDNAQCLNVIVSNLMARLAINGEITDCQSVLEEYRQCMRSRSINNVIEYNNFQIVYYRQIGDDRMVFNLIKDGYLQTAHKLSPIQKEMFKASTFRMLMSGYYRHDWFDGEVSSNIDAYMSLPLPERLFVLKEYMGVFLQTELRSICYMEPYTTFYKNILSYYQTTAIEEIDRYLRTIESYDILKYKNIILHKLNILKLTQGKEHIAKSKQQYLDLHKMLLDEGLQFDAANVLMILIDECSSPYNVLLRISLLPTPIYWIDYIDRNPPPASRESPDEIHLLYPCLMPPRDFDICPLQIEEIRNHIGSLINLYNSWQNHPIKIEFSVGIAATLMRLDRKDEAEKFWIFFKKHRLTSAHFAPWFRKDIAMLEMEFGADYS